LLIAGFIIAAVVGTSLGTKSVCAGKIKSANLVTITGAPLHYLKGLAVEWDDPFSPFAQRI
jgi:hypothetical protein